MRLERYFEAGMKPSVNVLMNGPIPLQALAFGPMAVARTDQWAEVYRIAYERTMAALRPTRYDRAMLANSN